MMMRFTGLAKQSFKMEKARRKVLGFTGAGWWLRRRWGRDSVITMDILVPSVPWGCSSSLWRHHPFSLATFITIFQFSSLCFLFSFLSVLRLDRSGCLPICADSATQQSFRNAELDWNNYQNPVPSHHTESTDLWNNNCLEISEPVIMSWTIH